MAGYVIHLAVAEAYIKKHPKDIDDYNQFVEGVIFPDSVSDKSITHYGEKSSKVNLKWFLKENKINNDYNKGYFLHLVTDYIFYNKFLVCFSKDIYNDYDILNKKLQEKFDVKIPENIKEKIFYKEGSENRQKDVYIQVPLSKEEIKASMEVNLRGELTAK